MIAPHLFSLDSAMAVCPEHALVFLLCLTVHRNLLQCTRNLAGVRVTPMCPIVALLASIGVCIAWRFTGHIIRLWGYVV